MDLLTPPQRAGSGRRLRRLLVGAWVASVALRVPAAAVEPDLRPTEYEVKAAYLYNFVRYIEWPPEALPEPGAPFVVAILGDDPFGAVLDDAFLGKSLADRPASIVRIHEPAEGAQAQIVFIAASESQDLPRIVKALAGRCVLTVGDAADMARKGAMIAFRKDGNRVRFDINVPRSESAGLRLSSQLLKVATIVGDER